MKNDKKLELREIFQKRWVLIAFSVVSAIALWVIVSYNLDSNFTREMKDIPLTLSSTAYKNFGLDIVDGEDATVSVVVEGKRNVVGSLTENDIIVVPNTSNVMEAGKYELVLNVSKASQLTDFVVVSVTPSTVELSFEVLATKKIPVTTEIDGLWAEDGYIIGTVSTTPSEITVTGPEEVVGRINSAVAKASVSGALTMSETIPGEITLVDISGNDVPLDNLSLDFTSVEISIPVLKKGVVALDIGFINAQDGFDLSTLGYVMSVDSINIAATEMVLDRLSTITVGYIDLSTYVIGTSYIFDINLPAGVSNIDNTTTVTVTFQRNDLTTKKIKLTDLRFENVPDGYDVRFITSSVTVTLVGPEEILNEIQSGSIVAIVDCNRLSLGTGEYDAELQFTIPGYDSVFVVGSYTALISSDVG